MENTNTGCWVVLPTYDERENISAMLERLLALEIGLNILVIDDDSPDGTADIAGAFSEKHGNVHLLRRNGKRGLGAAYLTGFECALKAGAEILVSMDADFSHQPETLPSLIEALNGAGCVVGSRYVAGGRIENWPMHRRLLSSAANRFVRLLFRMPISDCTSGYRVYRRSVIEDVVRFSPESQGYSFLVEILRIAAVGPLPVVESPICFVERKFGKSKMALHEILGGARSLLTLRLKMLFATKAGTAGKRIALEASDR